MNSEALGSLNVIINEVIVRYLVPVFLLVSVPVPVLDVEQHHAQVRGTEVVWALERVAIAALGVLGALGRRLEAAVRRRA